MKRIIHRIGIAKLFCETQFNVFTVLLALRCDGAEMIYLVRDRDKSVDVCVCVTFFQCWICCFFGTRQCVGCYSLKKLYLRIVMKYFWVHTVHITKSMFHQEKKTHWCYSRTPPDRTFHCFAAWTDNFICFEYLFP